MDFKTAHSRIIPYIFILAFIFSGCRKEDQETVVHIRCVTPHNNQPVKGCKVIVTEGKMKGKSLNVGFDAIQEFSGITDDNGVATIRFHYKKNNKFQYMLSKDYSGITPPNGMTDVDIITPKGWTDYLDKKQFEFNFTFNVLGSCGAHVKFENVNCSGPSDEMSYTAYNLSNNETESNQPGPSTYYGCGVVLESTTPTTNQVITGKHVYKLFIHRNNQTHIQYDTFNLQPGVMNEMIIEY